MISAKTLLSLGRRFQPEMMAKVADAYDSLDTDGQFLRPKPNAWNSIPVGSIDNTLVSKAANIKQAIRCSRITGTWSDLGSWPALMGSLEEDKDQNLSTENVSLFDCNHTNAWALQDGPVIVGLGLHDKTIVSTSDVIFVADNKRMDGLKELVQELEKSGVAEATSHKKHFRPWGWFESLEQHGNYHVKRLHVYPNSRLSFQSHKHRSEHWVVVQGEAKVTLGEDEFTLQENMSTYINPNQKHRLANETNELLTVIEVQTGSYFGEDDIERFDDDYDRIRSS